MARSDKKKPTWRDYFEKNELDKIIKDEIEEEDSEDGGGSDSDPSENNMDAAEFLQLMENAFETEPGLIKKLKTQP